MDKNNLLKYSNVAISYNDFLKMIKENIPDEEKNYLFEENSIKFDNVSDKLLKESYPITTSFQHKNHQNQYYNHYQSNKPQNQIKNFQRSSKVTQICKQEEFFFEPTKKPNNNNIKEKEEKEKKEEKEEKEEKVDKIDKDSFLSEINTESKKDNKSKNKKKEKTPQKIFIECEIDHIFEINEKLNFSKDEKFWYIYTDIFNSSYGPFSSNEIVILYMEKKIDGNSLIRPLDIFKNVSGDDFQKLINYDNKLFFFNKYYISKKCSDFELKFKDFRKKQEEEIKLLKEKEIKLQKQKEEEEKRKEEEIKSQKLKQEEEKIIKENEDKEKYNNKKENINDEINTNSSSKNESHISYNENHPILKKKKKKSKMVDLDIKTGFYTMTNQEKNFSEVYICGDNELLNNVPKK